MTFKAMIVDDEPFARNDLQDMLSINEEIDVVCEAGTLGQAGKMLSEHEIDVVFLDIQLRGGTGFDLVPFVNPSTDIVFITAYDAFAVRAFEINALDYILKPVTPDRLRAAIEKLKVKRLNRQHIPQNPVRFERDDRVYVHSDTGHLFVDLEEIVAVTSVGGNYAALYLKGRSRILSRRTLKEWERLMPESEFMRIHRATIINVGSIDGILRNKEGSWIIRLIGCDDTFSVSRRKVTALKRLISDIHE